MHHIQVHLEIDSKSPSCNCNEFLFYVRNNSSTYNRSITGLSPSTLKQRLRSSSLYVIFKLLMYVLSHGCLLSSWKAFFNFHTWVYLSCVLTFSGCKCLFVVYAFCWHHSRKCLEYWRVWELTLFENIVEAPFMLTRMHDHWWWIVRWWKGLDPRWWIVPPLK